LRRARPRVLALCLAAAGADRAAAQSPPEIGFERRVGPAIAPLEPSRRDPEALDFTAPAPPDAATRPVPSSDPDLPRVRIDRIALVGATRLEEELSAIVRPFEGRALAVVDLLALRDALTRAYVDAGYVTSGAVIPEQDLATGDLRIEIVEGALEEIVVIGAERLRPRFVRERLAREVGTPVAVGDVERALQRLLNDPAVARLDARLLPGSRRGLAVLEVAVEEAPHATLDLTLANDRSPSVGGTAATALFVVPSTFGFGDETRIELTVVEGGPEARIGYAVPLTTGGLRAFGQVSAYRLDVVEDPLDALDIQARSTSVALGLSYPLIDDADARLAFAASVERQETDTTLGGVDFSFAEGAEDGETVVTALRLTAAGERRSADRALVGRATVSLGFDAFGATIHGDGRADGRFASLSLQGLWAERLNPEGRRVIGRVNLQLASDSLLPVEQIAVGGGDTVRGYRVNTLVRDSGWTASLEWREPLGALRLDPASADPATGLFEGVLFTDHGGGWNVNRDDSAADSIHSIGAGLRWRPTDGVDVGFDFGLALTDDGFDGDALQDYGVHFRITARPF
jgi:hemolysin activation/secretion protein